MVGSQLSSPHEGSGTNLEWSGWTSLNTLPRFSPLSLAETLDGGQAFRWRYDSQDLCWQGIWSRFTARIRISKTGKLQASVPVALQAETVNALSSYLRCDLDWQHTVDQLPWRSDHHLAKCLTAFEGLRILKQPFAETVLCFLCSATKQIPQIKVMCQRMAETLGHEILPGIHALPTWEQLAAASEDQLRKLGLGFRAKNIKKTADILAAQPGLLEEIESSPYPQSKAALVKLPGIGEKIADCALLFGAAQLEAFPVDTWIIKTLEARYQLFGWNPTQLAHFGRMHFGPSAGLAQQFLFSFERAYPNTYPVLET